jgi:hypothetical protein
VSAIPAFTQEQYELIHCDDQIVAEFEEFRKARTERDAERETFRGDIAVANVEDGLTTIKKIASKMQS